MIIWVPSVFHPNSQRRQVRVERNRPSMRPRSEVIRVLIFIVVMAALAVALVMQAAQSHNDNWNRTYIPRAF